MTKLEITMRYWLMAASIHSTEIQPIWAGKPYVYDKVFPNDKLKISDIVYLSGWGGLYSWGYVTKKESYQDGTVGKEMWKVTVVRPTLRHDLVSKNQIEEVPELVKLFSYQETNLIELTVRQIKLFNQLLSLQTREIPPDPDEADFPLENSNSFTAQEKIAFIISRPIKLEEVRHIEFKEIKGVNPVGSIKNTADEYAVALHNVNGGRIFWGIRDSDAVVVGVRLSLQQRDEIRREVSHKLGQIQPLVPLSDFRLDIQPVLDEKNQEITDLFVVELAVPAGNPTELYATASGQVFIKTDGGKKVLDHVEKMTEILRRKGR